MASLQGVSEGVQADDQDESCSMASPQGVIEAVPEATHGVFVVVWKAGQKVFAHKSRDAEVIGAQPFGALVMGFVEGEWLSLREGGYMLCKARYLTPLDELTPG